MTWNHPGMKIPRDFWNSNSWKNSEWLTIILFQVFYLRFCDHSALKLWFNCWRCWASEPYRNQLTMHVKIKIKTNWVYLRSCFSRKQKIITRCVSTKRGRRKCQERSLAAYVERKPPKYTVEAASGSQKVGEDCCVVVLHAFAPF